MAATTIVTQGSSPKEDYGLDAIAKHNAATATEQFPPYREDAKGLGIYHDGHNQQYQDEAVDLQNAPTPRSTTASEGIRTRSGRSTRGRTDSPFTGTNNRGSSSPVPGRKRNKKPKADKPNTPKLTAPLSVLTKDMDVPCKDIDAWVHRSAETRRKEQEKRQGYITRPMNSFMLYRSAYADRTKAWCEQNNHQVVSSVAGESWPMEPEEVRNQFNEWAKIERANHQAAHPDYKFSPSKSTKKRKGEYSEDEDDGTDVDRDPDGEYRGGGSGRRVRQRNAQYHQPVEYPVGPVGFDSHPYFGQQATAYDASHYAYSNPGRPLPSNVVYDHNGVAYHPQTGQMIHSSPQQQYQQYHPYVDSQGFRVPTPASMNGAQGLGGYGLPGGQSSAEELFVSRTATPMHQQHYNQFGQPIYPQYHQQTPTPQQYGGYQPPPQPTGPSQQQMYEHQQYLHQASQPQAAIDPTLETELVAAEMHGQGQSHFVDAIGDIGGELADLQGYFEESTSPNQTLAPAPSWEPSGELGQ